MLVAFGLMVVLLVGAHLFAVVAMVAVSAWGWKHLDPDARIRARTGTSGIDWTMSKKTALLMTPLIGLIVVVAAFMLPEDENWLLITCLGLVVNLIFLAAHWYSVRRAALGDRRFFRRSAR